MKKSSNSKRKGTQKGRKSKGEREKSHEERVQEVGEEFEVWRLHGTKKGLGKRVSGSRGVVPKEEGDLVREYKAILRRHFSQYLVEEGHRR